MRKLWRLIALWACGGGLYCLIEVLWRGYTHPAMFLVGGICFLILGGINEWFCWDMSLAAQAIIGAVAVTLVELAAGSVLNLWLGLGIWDYSDMPFNLLGQICLAYAGWWVLLSVAGIILDDVLRWKLFGEEEPAYSLF